MLVFVSPSFLTSKLLSFTVNRLTVKLTFRGLEVFSKKLPHSLVLLLLCPTCAVLLPQGRITLQKARLSLRWYGLHCQKLHLTNATSYGL